MRKRHSALAAEAAREPATAKRPASVPARARDEAALVAAWESRPMIERPPRWRVATDGRLEPAGDAALTVIRTARLFHARNLDHAAQTFATLANALGIRDPEDAATAALAGVQGIGPRDHLESLLACQMTATHAAAMEMLRRAQVKEQPSQVVDACVNRATRLMRTFALQVTALKDYRARGNQTVTVQHVQVGEGGQAVVGGSVSLHRAEGGGDGKV
jgi:hypothetical protein